MSERIYYRAHFEGRHGLCDRCSMTWPCDAFAAQATIAQRDAQVAELTAALAGMLESYDLCMGAELAFSDYTRDMLRGVFIYEPERARALLARTPAAPEGKTDAQA